MLTIKFLIAREGSISRFICYKEAEIMQLRRNNIESHQHHVFLHLCAGYETIFSSIEFSRSKELPAWNGNEPRGQSQTTQTFISSFFFNPYNLKTMRILQNLHRICFYKHFLKTKAYPDEEGRYWEERTG